jgi:tetratricopeptide (TPR) repeat protein
MSENPKFIPTDRVSKKLKIVVIMLTVLIFLAFIALFNKFSNKQPIKNVPAVQEPLSNQHLVDEYLRVGTRLMNSGLKEQAIDQFIRVWEMQKFDGVEKAKAAQTVGHLYADLGNCPEALVWLFRAEVLDPEKILTPLIDACLAKVRNNIYGQ